MGVQQPVLEVVVILIMWMQARNAGMGAAAGGQDSEGFWNAVRNIMGGSDPYMKRDTSRWHRKEWPVWKGWPIRSKGAKRNHAPLMGRAANTGTYRVRHSDLDNRLRRLYHGHEQETGRTLSEIAANLCRAAGCPILAGCAADSTDGGRDSMPDGANLLIEHDGKKTAVQCIHGKPDERIGARNVKKFLQSCAGADVHHAIIITDSSFEPKCSDLADGESVEVDLWDWDRLAKNIRKYLLEMKPREGSA